MKTLVIHPEDISTDFLKLIYEGKGFTVLTESVSNSNLRRALIEHDRIIMLGHGSKDGLFGHKKMMIEPNHVQFLRKKQCVGIWCNADIFFNKYGLKGFYTGMFISEEQEAVYEGVYGVSKEDVETSNNRFAQIVGFHLDSDNLLEKVKDDYLDNDSAVVVFNHNRLYFKK